MTYSFIRLEFLLKTSFGKCFNLLFESVLQQKRKSVLTQIVKGQSAASRKTVICFYRMSVQKKEPVEKILIESKTKSISQTPA